MSDEISRLRQEVEQLRAQLAQVRGGAKGYYESPLVKRDWFNVRSMPEQGLDRGR